MSKIKLDIENPVSATQMALYALLEFIEKQSGYAPDFKVNVEHASAFFCSASGSLTLNGACTKEYKVDVDYPRQMSSVHGESAAKSKLGVLILAAKELGYEISFKEIQQKSPTLDASSFGRNDVLQALDVDSALAEIERLGIDMTAINNERDRLNGLGKRLTKKGLANLMFPRGKVNTILKKDESDSKPNAKPAEPAVKPTSVIMKSMRQLEKEGFTDLDAQAYAQVTLYELCAGEYDLEDFKKEAK